MKRMIIGRDKGRGLAGNPNTIVNDQINLRLYLISIRISDLLLKKTNKRKRRKDRANARCH